MSEKQQAAVLRANENFYQAIKTGDIGQMDGIWIKDEDIKCVHTGWPMLYGWEAVRESWENIFSGGGPLDIELPDIKTQISGNTAWVICIEKISYKVGDEIQFGFAQSTNIFVLDGSSWLLALHHASPIPAPRREAASDEVLQ